jgi:hypothetical protein
LCESPSIAEYVAEVKVCPWDNDNNGNGNEKVHKVHNPVHKKCRVDDVSVGCGFEGRDGSTLHTKKPEEDSWQNVAVFALEIKVDFVFKIKAIPTKMLLLGYRCGFHRSPCPL